MEKESWAYDIPTIEAVSAPGSPPVHVEASEGATAVEKDDAEGGPSSPQEGATSEDKPLPQTPRKPESEGVLPRLKRSLTHKPKSPDAVQGRIVKASKSDSVEAAEEPVAQPAGRTDFEPAVVLATSEEHDGPKISDGSPKKVNKRLSYFAVELMQDVRGALKTPLLPKTPKKEEQAAEVANTTAIVEQTKTPGGEPAEADARQQAAAATDYGTEREGKAASSSKPSSSPKLYHVLKQKTNELIQSLSTEHKKSEEGTEEAKKIDEEGKDVPLQEPPPTVEASGSNVSVTEVKKGAATEGQNDSSNVRTFYLGLRDLLQGGDQVKKAEEETHEKGKMPEKAAAKGRDSANVRPAFWKRRLSSMTKGVFGSDKKEESLVQRSDDQQRNTDAKPSMEAAAKREQKPEEGEVTQVEKQGETETAATTSNAKLVSEGDGKVEDQNVVRGVDKEDSAAEGNLVASAPEKPTEPSTKELTTGELTTGELSKANA